MTSPRADKDLLILWASFKTSPAAPDLSTRSVEESRAVPGLEEREESRAVPGLEEREESRAVPES